MGVRKNGLKEERVTIMHMTGQPASGWGGYWVGGTSMLSEPRGLACALLTNCWLASEYGREVRFNGSVGVLERCTLGWSSKQNSETTVI